MFRVFLLFSLALDFAVDNSLYYCHFQNNLREAGEIRLFKMGAEENSMCVVLLDDYKSHVLNFTKDFDVDHQLIGKWRIFYRLLSSIKREFLYAQFVQSLVALFLLVFSS